MVSALPQGEPAQPEAELTADELTADERGGGHAVGYSPRAPRL